MTYRAVLGCVAGGENNKKGQTATLKLNVLGDTAQSGNEVNMEKKVSTEVLVVKMAAGYRPGRCT